MIKEGKPKPKGPREVQDISELAGSTSILAKYSFGMVS